MKRIFSYLTAAVVVVAGLASGQRLAAQTPASVVLMNLPIYQQTSASVETLSQVAVVFDVTFAPGTATTGTTVTVQGPAGLVTLGAQSDGSYQASQLFATTALANAAFPNGTYTVTVGGSTPTTSTVTVGNGTTVAPVLITNYAALQAAGTQPVTPTWSAISGAQATDFIDVEIDDANGNQLFAAASGDLGLTPTATSLAIPVLPTMGVLAGNLSYGSVAASGANNGRTTVEIVNGFVVQFPLQLAVPAPQSQTVVTGGTVVFSPGFSGINATYQYNFNGTPITGATSSTYVLHNAQAANAGNYSLTVTDAAGTTTSAVATLSVVNSSNPGRLIDISVRGDVTTGSGALMAGFVVGGSGTSGTQAVLIRAVGPTLASFGVTGALADPLLQLWAAGSTTAMTTNQGYANNAQINSVGTAVFAFPLNVGSLDSAIYNGNLAAGAYTAQVTGASGDSGVALAEVYDATAAGTYTSSSPRLVNVSGRAQVGTGANVLIAGFVIGGTTSKTVLIRAAGPALVAYGLGGVLAAPYLQLYSSASPTAAQWTNTGWNNDPAAAVAVGAFAFGTGSADSAILVTLAPGAYSAEVSGVNSSTGVALIEVYEVP
jgi:hypothetical protein